MDELIAELEKYAMMQFELIEESWDVVYPEITYTKISGGVKECAKICSDQAPRTNAWMLQRNLNDTVCSCGRNTIYCKRYFGTEQSLLEDDLDDDNSTQNDIDNVTDTNHTSSEIVLIRLEQNKNIIPRQYCFGKVMVTQGSLFSYYGFEPEHKIYDVNHISDQVCKDYPNEGQEYRLGSSTGYLLSNR